MTLLFKIKLLYEDSKIPIKRDNKYILLSYEDGILKPGEVKKIKTGIAMSFPNQYFAYIHTLDDHLKRKITTLAGVADSDYRGEYNVVLLNKSDKPLYFKKGDEIAICHFVKIQLPELVGVNDLEETLKAEN
ncbi:Deoxyuridine 5'-triphosphate nucleotidohydrolase [Dictyocoela muelleri]|nr:Deoxyuridine 5'-triphosphate nucleotidohydrolase [Dictyocoela muelleri]